MTTINVSEWGTIFSRDYSVPLGKVGEGVKKERVKVTVCRPDLSITSAASLDLPLAPCGAEWRTAATLKGHFAAASLTGSRPHRYDLVGPGNSTGWRFLWSTCSRFEG